MRVCKGNKDDPHYDPRPRRVWVRDQEVMEPWVSADEFRRAVVLENGKVLNGAVYVERLNAVGESQGVLAPPTPNTGFSGASVFVPDKAVASTLESPAPSPKPAPATKHAARFSKQK